MQVPVRHSRQTSHLSYLAQAQAWLERFKRFWKRHEKSIQVPGVTEQNMQATFMAFSASLNNRD